MNLSRLMALVVAGCCLLAPLRADDSADLASIMDPNRQFSATIETTASGNTMEQKIFNDTGKVRIESNVGGMQSVMIMRPDEKKAYTVMVAQQMVMEMPLDPSRTASLGRMPPGTVTKIGPDTVDGVAAVKYKLTSPDNKVMWFWVNPSTKSPLKMAADDGSVTVVWKNFQTGPQDASLFEPPAGYKTMQMPSGMGGMPGGGAPPSAPGGGQ